MKKVIIILFLIALSFAGKSQKVDNWTGHDKVLHFTVSLTFGQVPIRVLREDLHVKHPAIKGAAIMFGVGMAKEWLYDSKPSYKDLTADFAGCLVSLALDKLLQKIEHKIYVKSQNKFLTLNKNQSWENSLQNR